MINIKTQFNVKYLEKDKYLYELSEDATYFLQADARLLFRVNEWGYQGEKNKGFYTYEHKYFSITVAAHFVILKIKKGYRWNGPTGVPRLFHFKSFVEASLPHDLLYQAIALGALPRFARCFTDTVFYRALRAGGWFKPFAWAAERIVNVFGFFFARNPKMAGE
ncbi:MAG: hypothetical protein CMB99_16330 [Flavobacteriaceae bacterium]|nr:hypothetical protein [Flavobacteriaceae bacterium]|tara:strand:- start:2475 stop:2966 length:492 start_codon:yes stop_codon:yes gene_type:complete